MPAASPCFGICRLHEATRVCIGCGRTGEEIAGWQNADHAERHAVVVSLPARLAAIEHPSVATDPPPISVQSTLERTLTRSDAAVVVGCHGAVAEFMTPPGERPQVETDGHTVTARVTGGAVRLTFDEGLALFATGDRGAAAASPRLLAAPAGEAKLPIANGLTRLGEDLHPIDRKRRGGVSPDNGEATLSATPFSGSRGQAPKAVLYDHGLGISLARFMIRSVDPVLNARLDSLEAAQLCTVLAEAGAMLLEASPDRVVESPLCRVEVTTAIPPPGGRSPRAPHTHLMPGAIALSRLLPPGIGCPDGLVPIALIYGGEDAQ